MEENIAQRIARVHDRIARAAEGSGRSREDIVLVAVTKTVDADRIAAAYDAGLRDFGENYVQEALSKVHAPVLQARDIRWHFIGHLQTNKVKAIAGRFPLIHSVDSLKVAGEIARRMRSLGSTADILLEVKLDPDPAKFGLAPEHVRDAAAEAAEIEGIRLQGLMGMAPFGQDAEESRPYFRTLRGLLEQLPSRSRHTLSMGMTGDFEVAVEEGATIVLIGSALFGNRIQARS